MFTTITNLSAIGISFRFLDGLAIISKYHPKYGKKNSKFGSVNKAGPTTELALQKASWVLPRIITSVFPNDKFPMIRGWAEKERLRNLVICRNLLVSMVRLNYLFMVERWQKCCHRRIADGLNRLLRVNQEYDYQTLPMGPTGENGSYKAVVPPEQINPKWDFMYFMEIMDNYGNGRIYPYLNKKTPYVFVKQIR